MQRRLLQELLNWKTSPKRIINYLSMKENIPVNQDNTLIIFDEIQEVPRALTSLKYFSEDAPEYHIQGCFPTVSCNRRNAGSCLRMD